MGDCLGELIYEVRLWILTSGFQFQTGPNIQNTD